MNEEQLPSLNANAYRGEVEETEPPDSSPAKRGRIFQAALSAKDNSASAIASGVPTWSQRPSMRMPARRSPSIARSKRRFSEKAPLGQPSKRRGWRMAAPE